MPNWPGNAPLNHLAYRSPNQNLYTNVQTIGIVHELNRSLTNQSQQKSPYPMKNILLNSKPMKFEFSNSNGNLGWSK